MIVTRAHSGQITKKKTSFSFFFTLLRLSCVLCEPISDGAKNFSSGVHKPNAVAVGIEKDEATTCLSLRESDGCGWMVHYLGEASIQQWTCFVFYFYASVKVKTNCCVSI